MKTNFKKYLLVLLGTLVVGIMLMPTVSFSGNANPGILPPNSKPYGMTYGEWSARWWQWAIGLPTDNNPLFNTADCSTGQLGPVWFLGGSFVSATDERNCNVPFGKALFFPIVNNECSDLEAPPWYGATPEDRRACATCSLMLIRLFQHATSSSIRACRAQPFRKPCASSRRCSLPKKLAKSIWLSAAGRTASFARGAATGVLTRS